MTDSRLRKAVVVYIWGDPQSKPYPSEHPDDVASAFGDDTPNLVPYVKSLLAEAYAEPIVLPGEDLNALSSARLGRTIRGMSVRIR